MSSPATSPPPAARLVRHTRRAGWSLLEVLLVSVLTSAFALLVANTVTSTSTLVRDSLVSADLGHDLRELSDTATRYLRGARPLGTCLNPLPPAGDQVALDSCFAVAETGAAFTTATADELVFYSYPASTVDSSSALQPATDADTLTVPARVRIAYELVDDAGGLAHGPARQQLVVTIDEPADGATYTSPDWNTGDTEPFLTLNSDRQDLAAVDADGQPTTIDNDLPPLFTYYDTDGNLIELVESTVGGETVEAVPDLDNDPARFDDDTAGLADIGMVRFRPIVSAGIANPQTATLDVFISVPGTARQQELQ